MLAVTDKAATAIEGLLASRELPEEAGVRLKWETEGSNAAEPRAGIRLDLVAAPESGDEVLEAAPVFLEPQAAEMLDDKLLDADVEGEQVRFAVREQD